MKSRLLLFGCLLGLTSCGVFQWWDERGHSVSSRETASLTVQHLMMDDESGFAEDMQERLKSLHHYYVLAQKHLYEFDRMEESHSEKIYQTTSYLSLLAIRTQTDEIEHEIYQVWVSKEKDREALKKKLRLKSEVLKFAASSKMAALSMENLIESLQVESIENTKLKSNALKDLTSVEIETEIKRLQENREFIIFEKNIEHLAHVMETKIDQSDKSFSRPAGRPGIFSGDEFPAKVWALTFNDGPTRISSEILTDLNKRNLKATFFQLASKVDENPKLAVKIKEAEMGLGSHSWNHVQLTKVGAATLNHEIIQATKKIEDTVGERISYFRLPYGAGASTHQIREKVADAGLVVIQWNVDSLDWIPQNPQKIVARTLRLMGKTTKDAGIILFHDVHERSGLAASVVMDALKTNGRKSCTIDQIVTEMNEGSSTVCAKN